MCKWIKTSRETQQHFWDWCIKNNEPPVYSYQPPQTVNIMTYHYCKSDMKKESGNLSFVPFSFYLSCPFKIGYFNLGVFLLPLTKPELRSFGWRRDHIWKLQASQSTRALLFYFPISFFYILLSRPSGVATVLGARTRSGPCVHLGSVEMIWMWVKVRSLDATTAAAGLLQETSASSGRVSPDCPQHCAEGGRVETRRRTLQPGAKVWINKRPLCDCDTFQNNASEMLDGPRSPVGIYECAIYSTIK